MDFRILQGGGGNNGTADGGDGGEGDEGGLDFHGTPLIISWLPLIDIAVLVAAMRWHKFSFYAHVFLALVVIGLTLGAGIPVIIGQGLYAGEGQTLQNIHDYAGLVVVCWLGIQMITGIFARVIQYSTKVSPNVCYWIKRMHYISSYLLMICAKFNYLNIQFIDGQVEGGFFVLLIIDIFILIFYLIVKFQYWTLSEEIIDNQLVDKNRSEKESKFGEFCSTAKQSARNLVRQMKQESFDVPEIKQITTHYHSESQISLTHYVIFNDFVYDTSDFKERHPGGERIMDLVNKREIDRFLYGCYGPELQPTVKPYNHTQDSLRLCGHPVAKIDRLSPMKGFQTLNKCQMVLCDQVTECSETFLIHLKPQKARLSFEGFEVESQIGQYFTLTLTNDKGHQRCTRLYTTIWCMRPQNVKMMEKNFPFPKLTLTKWSKQQLQLTEVVAHTAETMKDYEKIPLIIKRYQKGELTPKLFGQNNKSTLILSQPMGTGLKYDTISPTGSVIFVCGGTGILPFCDFIDLLFKRNKVLQGSNLSGMLTKNDPLVGTDIIKQRSFVFYCAIENASDLPMLTIHQLNNLCKSSKVRFTCVMRVKKGRELIETNYKSISFQKDYFTENIKGQIKEGNISQVYICGPPSMNSDVGKIMVENEVPSYLYHFM